MTSNVTYKDVHAAAKRIKGHAIKTPLLQSNFLNQITDADVFLKAETLQVTGSFKFRGAYNAISILSSQQQSKGVVAASSGNHAQGIAEAARLLGVDAKIVMPSDAPAIKIARTQRSGAEVILYDRIKEDRVAICQDIAKKTGGTFIHPYDNVNVVAGQGTAGIEICEQLQALGKTPDHVLICTGGGGLTAGITIGVREHFPDVEIHTCEPENFDDYARSIDVGERLSNATAGGSICDAIVTPSPGEISFGICKDVLAKGFVCSDVEAMQAVAFAYNELKLVVEPGGAIALAALLQTRKEFAGKTIVVTLSGGNMDAETLDKCLALKPVRYV